MNRPALAPALAVLFATALGGAAFAHHTDAKPRITGAWVRETPPGQAITAAYLTIENPDHQTIALVSASSPAAGHCELHDMKHEGEQMRMVKVERIEIPPQGKVELKRGGLHLMLFDLPKPLAAGENVKLMLKFEGAGEVVVEAEVRKAEGHHGHHAHDGKGG